MISHAKWLRKKDPCATPGCIFCCCDEDSMPKMYNGRLQDKESHPAEKTIISGRQIYIQEVFQAARGILNDKDIEMYEATMGSAQAVKDDLVAGRSSAPGLRKMGDADDVNHCCAC